MASSIVDAPRVLLLHGFGGSAARTWGDNGWIDLLGDAGRTVIAPDLLGHGRAAKPHQPTRYARMADLVAAVLPDEPVDGIGFSLGARILLELAVAVPGRFRRLVVAGVGANLFRAEPSAVIREALLGEADMADPASRYFAGLAAHPDADPGALVALIEGGQRPLRTEALAAVACPVLVVIGDRDFAGPPDALVESLSDASLVVLVGTDHFATPKDLRFIDAALDFVSFP